MPLESTRDGIDTIRGSGLTRSIAYPGARHEIFNEINQVEVLENMMDFIEEVLG